MIKRLAILWAISAGTLMLLPVVIADVHVDDWFAAIMASAIIGVINCLIRPVLRLFTLPLAIITIGLFTFVLNGFLFWFASELAPGFSIDGFWTAIVAAAVYSLVTWIASMVLLPNKD